MDTASQNSFFRIVDAAVNRASEGVRVAEDVMRMHLNDRFLASQLKELRHDLAEQVGPLSQPGIASRDSVGDVGRTIETASEYQRSDGAGNVGQTSFEALVIANLKRAQQAIRTLEELAKTQPSRASVQATKPIEQIRYRCYTIEKACRIALRSAMIFPKPSLYVLLDGCDGSDIGGVGDLESTTHPAESRLAKTVKALIQAEVDFVQLRDKKLSDRQLITAGKMIAQLVRDSGTRFIMNDRADLAVACGADGVHVGQDELGVADVRKIIGPTKIIGVSTHSMQQAKQAVVDGADYIGVGPIFPSQTKSFSKFVGLELVNEVCTEIGLPAFAIGGIDLGNIGQLAQAGCHRVAVTAAFSKSPIAHYADVAQRLRQRLNQQ